MAIVHSFIYAAVRLVGRVGDVRPPEARSGRKFRARPVKRTFVQNGALNTLNWI